MKLTVPQRIALAYVDEGHWDWVRADVLGRLVAKGLIKKRPPWEYRGYDATAAGRAKLREASDG